MGVAPPARGVGRPSYKKTLDHDIWLVSKFHQDRIKRHRAMLWRESQTDRHTDTTKIVVTAGTREPISADELFNRVDSDRTRSHSLRVKKRRVKTVVRQGTFTQRLVNAWNGLPGMVSLER